MSAADDAGAALHRVLRTLHLPAGPFQPAVERRALFEAGEGSHLAGAQLDALADAGGSDAHLVEYVWDWAREPEPLAIHPMDLRTGYGPVGELAGPGMEHAIVAGDGSWAVLTTEDLDAVVGGSAAFVDAVLPRLGVVDAEAAPGFLERFPDWAPGVLEHLYGAGWQARLGIDLPPAGAP